MCSEKKPCFLCDKDFIVNDDGTSNHVDEAGDVDHNEDADHTPYMIETQMNEEDKYQIVNDTAYHKDTPAEVIRILEASRTLKHRLLFVFGDVKTGKEWETCTPERGRVGRSVGKYKIPLLVRTSRSLGGEALMDDCILSIRESRGGKVVYRRSIPPQQDSANNGHQDGLSESGLQSL